MIFHVNAAVTLNLIGVAAGAAIEKVDIVKPDIGVVSIHRHGIITKKHYCHIAYLYVMCTLEAYAVAIECGVRADTLDSDVLYHAVGVVVALQIEIISVLQTLKLRVGHCPDDAYRKWTLLKPLTYGREYIGQSGLHCRVALLVLGHIERHTVDRSGRHI